MRSQGLSFSPSFLSSMTSSQGPIATPLPVAAQLLPELHSGQGQSSSSPPLVLPSRCYPRVREDITGRLQRGKRPHSLPRDKEEPLTIKPTNRFIDVTSQPPSVIDQSIGHSGQDGRHFAKINDRDQMIIISGWIRSFRSFACTPQHCLPDTLRYYETIHVF